MIGALLLSIALAQTPTANAETLIDLDVKDADVVDVMRLLAEIGEFNLVADPEVSCKATLRLQAVPWPQVLDIVLRTCGLVEDRIGENVVRVATSEQLRREYEQRRKYEEEKKLAGELTTTYRKLAYGRAKDIAPILQKFLSPRGSVVFDERTNTLIITDVAR